MKTTTAFLVAAAAIGTQAQAQAQAPDINSLPGCVRTCVQDMYRKANELGCESEDDYKCLCMNVNFTYGIRDCAGPNCGGNQDNAQEGVRFADTLCRANGVTITALDGSLPTKAPATGAGDDEGSITTTTTTGDHDEAGMTGAVVTSVLENGSTTTFTLGTATSNGDTAETQTTATTTGDRAEDTSSPQDGEDDGTSPTDDEDEEGLAIKAAAASALWGVAGVAALFI